MSEPQSQSSTTQAARDIGGQGKEAAQDVASTATDQATQVAREARDQARQLWSQSRDELSNQAGQQQSRISQSLRGISDELHSMADGSQQGGMATGLVREAAGHARTASQWLEARDPASLVEEVRGFARRRPGTFLAAAAILGVVGGRLTRATVDEKRDDSSPGSASGATNSTGRATAGATGDGNGYAGATGSGGLGTADGFPTSGVGAPAAGGAGAAAVPSGAGAASVAGAGSASATDDITADDITAGDPLGEPVSEVQRVGSPARVTGPVGAPRDDEVLP